MEAGDADGKRRGNLGRHAYDDATEQKLTSIASFFLFSSWGVVSWPSNEHSTSRDLSELHQLAFAARGVNGGINSFAAKTIRSRVTYRRLGRKDPSPSVSLMGADARYFVAVDFAMVVG